MALKNVLIQVQIPDQFKDQSRPQLRPKLETCQKRVGLKGLGESVTNRE